MLYPHGLPPLVNNNSHEQDMQEIAHHIEKKGQTLHPSYAKCNRIRNRFQTYSEVTSDEEVSDEEISSEDF